MILAIVNINMLGRFGFIETCGKHSDHPKFNHFLTTMMRSKQLVKKTKDWQRERYFLRSS